MRVIIAGSRDIDDYECLWNIMQDLRLDITEIVSGKARGVDTLGEGYARDISVPVEAFYANWNDLSEEPLREKINNNGKPYNVLAGFNRNERMAQYADVCVILRCAYSKGSLDMLKRAQNHKLLWYDYIYTSFGIPPRLVATNAQTKGTTP